MAEAEDVITDAARHATESAQQLWRRHRRGQAVDEPPSLSAVSQRLNLLLQAVFGRGFALRPAQAPLPPGLLARWMKPLRLPFQPEAVPATDGESLWLPSHLDSAVGVQAAHECYRLCALRQAMRALRGSPALAPPAGLLHEIFLLLEAQAADAALLSLLPGLAQPMKRLRASALKRRPPPAAFPSLLRPLEHYAREVIESTASRPALGAAQVLEQAHRVQHELALDARVRRMPGPLLWHDAWTGEFRRSASGASLWPAGGEESDEHEGPVRSARLARRPQVREALADEDDEQPGAWMVQTAQPQEAAEDPMGLQRPTDRDEHTASDEFADALSELPEARLVSTPGRPREVLLSDDPPEGRARRETTGAQQQGARLSYPEWDWQAGGYRHPGATVHMLEPAQGPLEWVERTLAARAAMLVEIRRRFELLRARRTRLRRQLDGDEIDLPAWVEAFADYRAGLPLAQQLYLSERRARRDMALSLLVDVSGSTDAWIAADRRIIDVEREALLLVCIALEGMAEPYSVTAFSGEGPQRVVVRHVKDFNERYGTAVAQRIAGLEPEHFTRAGAAIRHASAGLMRQQATHRLLLLLSDGKPNDVDAYEGRYGVEDMRQAVTEARLQGISTFCLTIDRQAASYLPAVFGAHHYALLPRPELLPTVLLEWLRRLVSA